MFHGGFLDLSYKIDWEWLFIVKPPKEIEGKGETRMLLLFTFLEHWPLEMCFSLSD